MATSDWRLAFDTISASEINSDDSYAVINWPVQSDQDYPWFIPDNDADRVRKAAERVQSMDGHSGGYGGAEFTWNLRMLTPGQVQYLWETLFARQYSADVTVKTRNRANTAFQVYHATVIWPDEADLELGGGGYDRFKLAFTDAVLATGGPALSLSKTITSGNLVFGFDTEYRLTVTNTGSEDTYDDVVVTDTIPEALDFVSQAGVGWTASYSSDGVTYVSSMTASLVRYVRWTRSDALGPNESHPNIQLALTPNDEGAANNTAEAVSGGLSADATVVGDATALDLGVNTYGQAGIWSTGVDNTLYIDLANTGGASSTGTVSVVITVPPSGLTVVSANAPSGWTRTYSSDGATYQATPPANTSHVRWQISTALSPTASVQFTVTVTPTGTGTQSFSATVSASHDINNVNDTNSDSVEVT